MPETLTIEPESGRKGRVFQAELLAWIKADSLFPSGITSGNYTRPAWISYASSQMQTKMFSSNFLHGKVAEQRDRHGSVRERFQLLKSEGYRHHTKKVGSAIITTAYVPNLFWLDPGMVDPDSIQFIVLMSKKWLKAQRPHIDMERCIAFAEEHSMASPYRRGQPISESDMERLVPEAKLFLMYLDRRSRFPIPQDTLFAIQLLHNCLQQGMARRHTTDYSFSSFRYNEYGFGDLGLPPGIGFQSTHEKFGEFLAQEVKKWHV